MSRYVDGVIFEVDALTKTVQKFFWDPQTEQFTITDEQDVTELVEQNKALRNDDAKADPHSIVRRVASIPNNIMEELRVKGILADEKKFRAWLNDPDNRAWRTNNMKV